MPTTDAGSKPAMTLAEARRVLDSDALVCDMQVIAAVLQMSPWSLYEATKAGTAPVAPIRVGRRLKFRVSDVRALLGLDPTPAAGATP